MAGLCRDIFKMKKILIVLFTFLLFQQVFSQSARKKVIEGNELFLEEKYDQALNKYLDAQVDSPESPDIKHNIGSAQYKKSKYEDAMKEYEACLSSDDAKLQERTYYNMGNTLYRMNKWPESIMSYKKALELDPDDQDAKYNLEFVRRQLKDKSQKQQQDQQKQQQQQQDQQQQDQQNKDQENQDQQEQQQQQDQQQQDEQNKDQENQDQQEQQQQQQQMQAQEQNISKEDAERILEALKEDKEKLKDAQRKKMPGRMSVSKDW